MRKLGTVLCQKLRMEHIGIIKVSQYSLAGVAKTYKKEPSTVNILDKAPTESFMKQFLSDQYDPVKSKWNQINKYSSMAKQTGILDERIFNNIRQRYELFELYDEKNYDLIQNNTFLKKIYDYLPEQNPEYANDENILTTKSLTEKQRIVVKRILNEELTKKEILMKLENLCTRLKNDKLIPVKKVDSLIKSFGFFVRAPHSAYGHPYIVQLREKWLQNGTLSDEEYVNINHYGVVTYSLLFSGEECGGKSCTKYCQFCLYSKFNPNQNEQIEFDRNTFEEYLKRNILKYKVMNDVTNDTQLEQKLSSIVTDESKVNSIVKYINTLGKNNDILLDYLFHNPNFESHDKLVERILNRIDLDLNEEFRKLNGMIITSIVGGQNPKLEEHKNALLLGNKLDEAYTEELRKLALNAVFGD